MIPRQLERAMEQIEDQLADETDPESRKLLMYDLRELEREAAEYERWQEEGNDRGWT